MCARETRAERLAYWREFCSRDVAPTCVIDFPFADDGGLDLATSPEDERVLERLYCFEDYEDDAHLVVGGRRRRVLVKAHTLRKWRDRGDKLFLRAAKVTAVKVMYAHWNPDTRMFEQEKGAWLKLLPVSKSLQDGWREFYQRKRFADIEWESSTPSSIPAAEDQTSAEVRQLYEQVRAAIQMGERLFPKGATPEHAAMKGYHSAWKETCGVWHTNKMLRGSREVEYEVFMGADVADGLEKAWRRPMHWAGFLAMGASTRLPLPCAAAPQCIAVSNEGITDLSAGVVDFQEGVTDFHECIVDFSADQVCAMVAGIGFADAAHALKENRVDGKTLASEDFDEFMCKRLSEGGLGLTPMQKLRLKKEIEALRGRR